jgi:hypothetical protein
MIFFYTAAMIALYNYKGIPILAWTSLLLPYTIVGNRDHIPAYCAASSLGWWTRALRGRKMGGFTRDIVAGGVSALYHCLFTRFAMSDRQHIERLLIVGDRYAVNRAWPPFTLNHDRSLLDACDGESPSNPTVRLIVFGDQVSSQIIALETCNSTATYTMVSSCHSQIPRSGHRTRTPFGVH